MIATTFNQGNYNYWENLITTKLPELNSQLRQLIIPTIDKLLSSMLGANAGIEKTSIDVAPVFNDKATELQAVIYNIVYTIQDFNAPEAPQTAIDSDTATIKNYLDTGESLLRLQSIEINVNGGLLRIQYKALIER